MSCAGEKNASRSAFTILEVVFAMSIIFLVFGGAFLVIRQSCMLVRSSRNQYVATSLCDNRLERARTLSYNSLWELAENQMIVNENGVPDPNAQFRRTTAVNTNYVTTAVDATVTNTQITVTVEIHDMTTGNYSGQQEQMSDIFANYTLSP